jgi:hypothetical protein
MPKVSQLKTEIAQAATAAVQAIADAASKATSTIATAAEAASKVVSTNAATAAQALVVKNVDGITDHDLITKIDVKLDNLKADVADIKSGVSKQIDDHETRIRRLELWGTLAVGGAYVIIFWLKFVFKQN